MARILGCLLLREGGFDQPCNKGDNCTCHIACCFCTQTVDFEFQLSEVTQGRVVQFSLCHLCSLSVHLRPSIALTDLFEIHRSFIAAMRSVQIRTLIKRKPPAAGPGRFGVSFACFDQLARRSAKLSAIKLGMWSPMPTTTLSSRRSPRSFRPLPPRPR